ncbi:MAG: isoprenylcysteine carboxylmethyltransferase family protein [Nitrospirota bacterium]
MSGSSRFVSFLLVAVQFLCVAAILLTGPLVPASLPGLGLAGLGLALGLWAILTMPRRSLHVLPDVRDGATLVTQGPYRYVRHPMYTALLGVTLVLVLEQATGLRLTFWLVLLADLIAKLLREERFLIERFGEYREYRARTFRLVPFVF